MITSCFLRCCQAPRMRPAIVAGSAVPVSARLTPKQAPKSAAREARHVLTYNVLSVLPVTSSSLAFALSTRPVSHRSLHWNELPVLRDCNWLLMGTCLYVRSP